MFGIGTQELVIIFLIVLLLFGGRRIPEIARAIGKAMREFRNARNDFTSHIEETSDQTKHDKNAP